MNAPIFLVIAQNQAELQRSQAMLDTGTVSPAILRGELWKRLTNLGVTHVLDEQEHRSPVQLAEQIEELRKNTPEHVPVALFLHRLEKSIIQQVLKLLPEAYVIGPSKKTFYGHSVLQTPEEVQGTLSSINKQSAQKYPNDTLSIKSLFRVSTTSPVSLKTLQDAQPYLDKVSRGSIKIEGIAPLFSYANLISQVPKTHPVSLFTPSLRENPWANIETKKLSRELDPQYSIEVFEESFGSEQFQRLECSLNPSFDLKDFLEKDSLYLPVLNKKLGIVISAKAPMSFTLTVLRTITQLNLPWYGVYTPQQVDDASQYTQQPNYSPAMVIYPPEKLGYIPSYPHDLRERLLRSVERFAHDEKQRESAKKLRKTVSSQGEISQNKKLFDLYCSIYAAAGHVSSRIQKSHLSIPLENVQEIMESKAAKAILRALEKPQRTEEILQKMQTEYITFGSLFEAYAKDTVKTTELLSNNLLPHFTMINSKGAIAPETLVQVLRWYEENYEDKEFVRKVSEKFSETNWLQADSRHFELYYSPKQIRPDKSTGKLIGYMQASSPNAKTRYLSNLHISPPFQGYHIMLPFFAAALKIEGNKEKIELHSEPGSIAEQIYLKHFAFQLVEKETYLKKTDGTMIYLNRLRR